MVLVDGLLGGGERTLEGLDGEVRRQSAGGLATVHGTAGEREADTHLACRADDRAGQVAGAPRVDVVVVHGGGDSAAGHHGEEPWAAARAIGSSIRAHVGYSATSQLNRLWSVARPRVIHW